MVLEAFVSKFIEELVDYAKQRISSVLGVSEEMKKLLKRLHMIENLLADAERKQLESEVTKYWLDQLKEVMFEAEDLIDEYKIQAQNFIEEENEEESTSRVSCCYTTPLARLRKAQFKSDIADRIKAINLRLDGINKDVKDFNLVPSSGRDRQQSGDSGIRRRTSPLMEPNIVGGAIESDTKKLVEQILNQSSHNILFYAIVGIGGIGKTTLAQKIYNEEFLRTHFHPVEPIWVCISQQVDEIRILKLIIKGLGADCGDAQEKEELLPLLGQVAKQKKFFLVLDDVWDASVWEDLLRTPLHCAGTGSRILITTREEQVARGMGVVQPHKIALLSDEDCWSLLCKIVFRDGEEESKADLREIGMAIVKKCHGLPLAVRTIAGVLRQVELHALKWRTVLENLSRTTSKLPDGVHEVLFFSYANLPPHLKQCFLYLSIFPEDYEYREGVVVPLWVAEGFIKGKEEEDLEEIGIGYFKGLVDRGLLQHSYEGVLGTVYKMHDLLWSLARHLTGSEVWCGPAKLWKEVLFKSSDLSSQRKPHRVYIFKEEEEHVSFSMREKEEGVYLRTLLTGESSSSIVGVRSTTKFSIDDFRSLSHLRVLRIQLAAERPPESLGNLKHLRYLNLGKSAIREMPDSIGLLRNLQYLDLCACLALQRLPKSIGLLTSLLYLDVELTKLDSIPFGVTNLQKLQTLKGFVLPDDSCMKNDVGKLEDLRSLGKLKTLSIRNLERASRAVEGKGAFLENTANLNSLTLWCGNVVEEEAIFKGIEEIMEDLRPPSELQELYIQQLWTRRFPKWMVESPSVLQNLRILDLYYCPHCKELPTLYHLPCLEALRISRVPLVVEIGPGFFLPPMQDQVLNKSESRVSSFPKLETLQFSSIGSWKEWRWMNEEEHSIGILQLLPRLKELKIFFCKELRCLPHTLLNHATALTGLEISSVDKLEEVENLCFIRELKIFACHALKRIRDLPLVESLYISDCWNLEDVDGLPKLQKLLIRRPSPFCVQNLQDADSLRGWLLNNAAATSFPRLQNLQFQEIKLSLIQRFFDQDAPDWTSIRHIQHVDIKTHNEFAFVSYTKSPFSFSTHISPGILELEEKAKSWPEQVTISSLHEHPLLLARDKDYICNKCNEKGQYISYCCRSCGFDLHPVKCAIQEEQSSRSMEIC